MSTSGTQENSSGLSRVTLDPDPTPAFGMHRLTSVSPAARRAREYRWMLNTVTRCDRDIKDLLRQRAQLDNERDAEELAEQIHDREATRRAVLNVMLLTFPS